MFKLEIEDDVGIWTDVKGADGKILTFAKEDEAREALAKLYPVKVQMEKFAGGKTTRVVRVFGSDKEWKDLPPAN